MKTRRVNIAALVALITHPNTPRNERANALAIYERTTGREFDIVTAREYMLPESIEKTPVHTNPTAPPGTIRRFLTWILTSDAPEPQKQTRHDDIPCVGTCEPDRNPRRRFTFSCNGNNENEARGYTYQNSADQNFDSWS